MKYNFDITPDRRGTNSVKWDKVPDVIPMWIADMDFPSAPCIIEALHKRIDHGVFGYTLPRDEYYNAAINWFGQEHGWHISKDQIIPIEGIVPAIAAAAKAFAAAGSKIVINSPAYNCFFSSLKHQGCEIVENKMVRNGDSYVIDFDLLERQCSDPEVKAFLLCNPHNPSGRCWTREELTRIGDICLKRGIPVISDEIHCEITSPGTSYIPFASIKPEFAANSVSFCSPTKAFNIAGLEIANIVSANEEFRERIKTVIANWEHRNVNQLGIVALPAAYSIEGKEWLNDMREYVWENYRILKAMFTSELPEFTVIKLEATYLVWVDCSSITDRYGSADIIEKELKENFGVYINSGSMYGDKNYIRINIACSRNLLKEGCERIIKGLKELKNKIK